MSHPSHPSAPLADKVALVTGGSRGIGAAIARRLSADGAAVALTYNASPDKANEVVAAIAASGGRALAIRADAGDAAAVGAAVAQTAETWDRLDILVNNAGITIVKPIDEITLEEFDRMVSVNIRGLFVATQAAVRLMGQGGRVVNIGSINSEYVPYIGGGLYVMTKGAVSGLTHALARDLGPRGITVNNIMPGPTDTDMNPASGEFATQAREFVALRRYAQVDEIAAAVAYLAGPGAAYITGADIPVDGGYAA
jgi:3-oxoacyl-[acyl-carrier protein] reductase